MTGPYRLCDNSAQAVDAAAGAGHARAMHWHRITISGPSRDVARACAVLRELGAWRSGVTPNAFVWRTPLTLEDLRPHASGSSRFGVETFEELGSAMTLAIVAADSIDVLEVRPAVPEEWRAYGEEEGMPPDERAVREAARRVLDGVGRGWTPWTASEGMLAMSAQLGELADRVNDPLDPPTPAALDAVVGLAVEALNCIPQADRPDADHGFLMAWLVTQSAAHAHEVRAWPDEREWTSRLRNVISGAADVIDALWHVGPLDVDLDAGVIARVQEYHDRDDDRMQGEVRCYVTECLTALAWCADAAAETR